MIIKDKIKIDNAKLKKPILNNILWSIGFFVAGLILGLGQIVNGAKPFGISIVCVAKKRHLPFALAGALIGYLLSGFDEVCAKYVAGVLIGAIGSLAADAFDLRHNVTFLMTIAFLSNLAPTLILNIHLANPVDAYLFAIGESILSAGGLFFFYKSLNSSYRRLRFKALPISDISCIITSFSIILLNLTYINIYSIVPVRILAFFITLTAIEYKNQKWAMMNAICLGFALSIAKNGDLFILGALCLSVMIANLFESYSIYAVGFSFLCVMGFFCIASNSQIATSVFVESLIAVLLLVLMPERINEKLEKFWEHENDAPQNQFLRQSLVLKLRFASSAMAAISQSVDQVREKINIMIRNENQQIKPFVSDEEYLTREIILEKTNQIRMVAGDQFFSIADMLEDLAFEFDEAETFNAQACMKIRRMLGEYNIFPKNITAIEDKYNRMRVEILIDSNIKNISNLELNKPIGKICNRYFESGKITYFNSEALLAFFERPNYKLSVGFAQHAISDKLCGDTVKVVNDNKGHTILVISDGMGTGNAAALDGAMGAGLLSKLINAGFGFDSSLKVVNSALLVKSNDESLATLDIANIDLFTGKCELLKAGSPATYIIKENEIQKCELTSMPAGILRGIEFAKRNTVLKLNDSIVLMSDGITDLGENFIREILTELKSNNPQYCANKILESAIERSNNKPRDDMSVIYATLNRN